MPLQNRVTPFGEIVATSARGTMMGNRGGRFHRDDRTLGRRRWASHHWICCELHYKGRHHEPMGQGYTSLFFLDEVTALAAGHRPCFFCRRPDAKRFFGFTEPRLSVDAADRLCHEQRLSGTPSFTRKAGDSSSAARTRGEGGARNARRVGSIRVMSPLGNATLPMLRMAAGDWTALRCEYDSGFLRDHERVDCLPDGAMIAIGEVAYAVKGNSLLRWSAHGYDDARPRASAMTARLLTPPLYVGILARGYEPRWHPSALAFERGAA